MILWQVVKTAMILLLTTHSFLFLDARDVRDTQWGIIALRRSMWERGTRGEFCYTVVTPWVEGQKKNIFKFTELQGGLFCACVRACLLV